MDFVSLQKATSGNVIVAVASRGDLKATPQDSIFELCMVVASVQGTLPRKTCMT
jgi:hypothetical protein